MTLTQTCLKLLEKEENRELVNKALDYFQVQLRTEGPKFYFDDHYSCYFSMLNEMQQREVIRVCLDCLPFFERENPEFIDMSVHDPRYESTPKTLKAKYQARLFLPIPDLDKEFEGEGITKSDL